MKKRVIKAFVQGFENKRGINLQRFINMLQAEKDHLAKRGAKDIRIKFSNGMFGFNAEVQYKK